MLRSNVRYGTAFNKDSVNVTCQSTLEYYPGVLTSMLAFGIAFRNDSGVLPSMAAFGTAFGNDSGNVTLWSTLEYCSGVLPWSITLEGHTKKHCSATLRLVPL